MLRLEFRSVTYFAIALAVLLGFSSNDFASDKPLDQGIQTAKQISVSIDNTLKRLEPYKDAVTWAQGLVQLMDAYPFADFVFLEGRLRKLKSSTYLIAAPIATAPKNTCARALILPVGQLDYYLWISVNGRDEADEEMRRFGTVSYEQNRARLHQTGFLVLVEH